MEHSIAARFTARPAATFPRPSVRSREPRLGLGAAVVFRAHTGRTTVLRAPAGSTVAALRGGPRAITPTRARNSGSGLPRPSVSMTWARSVRVGRSSAVTAPWLG